MHKKLTITVDENVYEGLHRVIGRRRISQSIESLLRPHVVGKDLLDAPVMSGGSRRPLSGPGQRLAT